MKVAAPLARVMPELAQLPYGQEPLASCGSCAMAPRASDPNATFSSPTRCCTYHPRLANFLAGSALRRGGVGAERVRARLVGGDGVGPLGIVPGEAWWRRWTSRAPGVFGRDPSYACPYWIEGPLGCSIHEDRDAVCRTWHCKVVAGQRGQQAWTAVNVLLAALERRLAVFCAERLPFRPEDPAASYVAAAELLDTVDDAELAPLRTPRLASMLASAVERAQERDLPLPDVVQPTIASWERRPEGLWVSSFSPFDRVLLPPWSFELLSRLDGRRTWREAVDLTSEALGFPIEHDLVWRWWSRGLVGLPVDPEGSDVPVLTWLPEL